MNPQINPRIHDFPCRKPKHHPGPPVGNLRPLGLAVCMLGWLAQPVAGNWIERIGQTETGPEIRGVAHGNGTFVAVGTSGTILTSGNGGQTWADQEMGGTMNAVAFGNNTFIAVGDLGLICRSVNNGAGWTESFLGTSMHGVAFGNSTFVAVGDNGVVRRSADNGVNWSTVYLGATLRAVAFGNNTFVAVGDNGMVRRSVDNGLHWSDASYGGLWRGIAFGDGVFVAAGGGGLLKWSDDDGVTWRDPTSPAPWPGGEMYGVAYGAGRFVAVGLNALIWESDYLDVASWRAAFPGGQLRSAGFGDDTFVVAGMLGILYTQEATTPGISPSSLAFAQAGGTGLVHVTMPAGTGWSATPSAPWITITSGASGSGTGTVRYSVSANPNTSSRSGAVTVSGFTHSVTQSGQSYQYSILPTLATYQYAGGAGSIAVTATAGAPWNAAASQSWITINSGSGSGSGTVNYTVAVNNAGVFRSGTITLAGQICTIEQDPAVYRVSPATANFAYTGGGGTFAVSASTGAPWLVGSNAAWLRVTTGGSGTGSGNVTYAVDQNNSPWSRTGTLTLAGQSHTVHQAAPVFAITPTALGYGSTGGSGLITVTTSPGVTWTASESLGWISFTSAASGTGNGSVTYSVAGNGGSDIRTGNIWINGLAHEVNQAPAGYYISPVSSSFAAAAIRPHNEGSITVTVPSGFNWTASTPQSWITITSGSSGSGSGVIGFRVSNNTSLGPRSGWIEIGQGTATVRHRISQSGGTLTVSPLTVEMAAAGGSDVVTVTATAGVPWTAVANHAWIVVTGDSSGTGSGTVSFKVEANTVVSARVGTLTVGGETVTLVQAGVIPSFSISPYSAQFSSAAGVGEVVVTGTSGISWTSQSHASWLAITAGASGNGNGTLRYNVHPNPNPSARVGTLTIAGETHTVNQAGLNPYAVLPASQSYTPGGGTLIVNVAAPAGTPWSAASEVPWIQVTSVPPNGVGNGSFAYGVEVNNNVAGRSGRIQIGTDPHYGYHTVNQSGAAASFSISPASAEVTGRGGEQDVVVTATGGAAWTATSPVGWITWVGGTNTGVGNGVATYGVAPNPATVSRSATLAIAGKPHLVTQRSGDAPDSCVLSPSSIWENRPAGTLIGTLSTSASIPVTAPTYELHSIPGIVDNTAFTISGSQLFSAAVLDADRKDVYQVGVRVGNGHGDYHIGIVTVFVINDWLEDADGDGLPEEDEETRHGTSDTVADSDGDGLNDGNEINLTGTLPLDANSTLRISEVNRIGNILHLGWESVPGKSYHLMAGTDLSDGTPDPVAVVTANAAWTAYPVAIGSHARRFFRLAMFPPKLEEIAKLTMSDGLLEDRFGEKVSIDGDTLVVGVKFDEEPGQANGYNSGAAYVYQRDRGGADRWGLVRKLRASDAAAGDQFGYAVGIDGDTIVVGAKFDNSLRGAAYVFARNQGGSDNWGEVRKLVAADGESSDIFGYDVEVQGDRIVVGSVWDDSRRGAAYLYERNAGGLGNWGEVMKLTASDREGTDEFGGAVTISGDTIGVGSHLEDERGANAGAVYLFERNHGGPGNWGEVRKIVAADGVPGDQFGEDLIVDGDTLVVTAPYVDDRAVNAGAVYVFERNQSGAEAWGLVRKVHAPDAAAVDLFGVGVGLDGDRLLVGAWATDDYGDKTGAAYLFHRNWNGPGRWGQVRRFVASDAAADSHFGWRAAISGQVIAIGAPADDETADNAGACYIFYEVEP